jgi:UDP-2-acetamido-2,6-beta-L-arabino-hexul-4-ose reductase
MKRVGVIGYKGFIGAHLFATLGLYPEKYNPLFLAKDDFQSPEKLIQFVDSCDAVVLLAGINRHSDQDELFVKNLDIATRLADAILVANKPIHVLFSSSTQEERENKYGNSKKESRVILEKAISSVNGIFTGLLIPNVFGPFCKPYYNSVVATFCHQLIEGDMPKIEIDAAMNLIHVGELIDRIIACIDHKINDPHHNVPHAATITVSELLQYLIHYQEVYYKKGIIPDLKSRFEINLFNTFRSYIPIEKINPVAYVSHRDDRGAFTELIKLNTGGQVSFSTTKPSITRGNHFHTRKIERFSVIQGEAVIQLRRIGTERVFEFRLSGQHPAYVDMPVWYTHNITNVGDSELLTVFWISEFYDPTDPDTFFEIV